MKYVFATIEFAIFMLVALFLGDWATSMVSEADDVANVIGVVGGLGGAALLVYALVHRVRFYTNG